MRKTARAGINALVIFSLAAAHLFGRAAAAEESAGKPSIEVGEPSFDFGSVPQGHKVTHDFVIKNTGSAPLRLDNIVPSCGCTATSAEDSTIAPGAEGKVHVEFDTAGFRGEKVKTVRIFSNDTENPTTILSLRGEIEVDVAVEPSRILFGEVVRGKKAEEEVTVTTKGGLKIIDFSANSPDIKLEILERKENLVKGRVTLSPDVRVGELRSRLLVTLEGEPARVVNVPVFASVQGDLRLKPQTVSFGVIEGSEILKRSVKFTNQGDGPVTIKELKSDSPAVTTDLETIQPGSAFVIHVHVDPKKLQQNLRAVVQVVTDREEEQTLSLNVLGVLPPRT